MTLFHPSPFMEQLNQITRNSSRFGWEKKETNSISICCPCSYNNKTRLAWRT
uniref:Uncharacterized protein n=1 Tax=Rhizophora mucronata TaxID=61149 RepID=A0A2P2J1N2_RHIMU